MSLPEVKTILYTTSMGQHNRPVFRHAVKLANLYQAKILMLHVVEPICEVGRALILDYVEEGLITKIHDEGIDHIKQSMKERVVAFYEQELHGAVDLDIEQLVAEGNHVDAIIDSASQFDVDLIVMGSHNRLGRSSGTTRSVIKYGKRPVMVVPTEG